MRTSLQWTARIVSVSLIALILSPLHGCKSTATTEEATIEGPNYVRPLGPGESALREVTDEAIYLELLETSYDTSDALLVEATRKSRRWFDMPSAATHFPIAGVEFEHARDSVDEMLRLLEAGLPRQAFVSEVMDKFALYQSVGWNGEGTVLFTGYYAPEFNASMTRTERFQYPLYKRPADLVTDPKTGKPLGVRRGDQIAPCPSRREIEESGMYAGNELVWFEDPLEVYIAHINGSARLRLTDNRLMYIGYAGKTDRPYKGLGSTMIERGLVDENELSLPKVREYFYMHPDEAQPLIYENENYVFFQEYPEGSWPSGSLGFRVTEKRTLATDKAIFPRGGIMIVDTHIRNYSGQTMSFVQMMLDQDTGGAIQAPGRADIYMGQGKAAELLAGGQYQEGFMYYLFLRRPLQDSLANGG